MKKLILSCLFAATVGLLAGCSKSSSSDSGAQPPAQTPSQPPPSAAHTNAN
jgi:hypothetical protein